MKKIQQLEVVTPVGKLGLVRRGGAWRERRKTAYILMEERREAECVAATMKLFVLCSLVVVAAAWPSLGDFEGFLNDQPGEPPFPSLPSFNPSKTSCVTFFLPSSSPLRSSHHWPSYCPFLPSSLLSLVILLFPPLSCFCFRPAVSLPFLIFCLLCLPFFQFIATFY